MFFHHVSNRTEWLVEQLAGQLRHAVPSDPMLPPTVVVGNRGMERWIRAKLGRLLGIAANLDFPFVADALSAIYQVDAATRAVWRPEALRWTLLQLLPGVLSDPQAKALAAWLDRSKSSACDTRDALALATELAAMLDRIALFRKDWALAWERGQNVDGAPDWQGLLWRSLRAQLPPHPAHALNAPLEGDPLHVFCVPGLAPLHLDAWARAGTVRDVHLYTLSPTQAYVGEDGRQPADGNNTLLASLGRVLGDGQVLMQEVAPDAQESEHYAEPAGDTKLARLQSALLAGAQMRAEDVGPTQSADDSLQVHATTGAARSVTVAKTRILALFEAHPHLQPRDVLVMTPDLGAYAPLVQAEFPQGYATKHQADGWGELGAPKLAVKIADLGLSEVNPIAQVLLLLLGLTAERLTLSQLSTLMGLDVVQRRFSLSAEGAADAVERLHQAGARWGWDGEERARFQTPNQAPYTLDWALDRLALGAVLADDDRTLTYGRAPVDSAGVQGVGVIADVVATVQALRTAFRQTRAVGAWVEALRDAADRLTRPASAASFLRVEVDEALSAWQEEAAAFTGSLDALVVRDALNGRFDLGKSGDRSEGGAVTVCAMQPMRSVPFKVVVLLGIDNDTFPRRQEPRAFDSTRAQRRRGDREPRDDDKHLFLECIASAREHLLVLYTGRDPQTGTERPPAAPVADFIAAVPGLKGVEHPAQPHGDANFAYRQFDQRHLKMAKELRSPRSLPAAWLDIAEGDGQSVPMRTLADLRTWVLRPVRQYLQHRLGVKPPKHDEQRKDREPLDAANALYRHQIEDTVLHGWLAGNLLDDDDPVRLLERAKIPAGGAGITAVRAALSALRVATAGVRPPTPQDLSITVGGEALTGRIWLDGDRVLIAEPGDAMRPRKILQARIELFAAVAAGVPVTSAFVTGAVLDNGAVVRSSFPIPAPATAAEAQAELEALHQLAREAQARPIRLFEKCSWAYAKAWRPQDPRAAAAALEKAGGAWDPYAALGEGDDPALRLAFGQSPPFRLGEQVHPEFHAYALRLWQRETS